MENGIKRPAGVTRPAASVFSGAQIISMEVLSCPKINGPKTRRAILAVVFSQIKSVPIVKIRPIQGLTSFANGLRLDLLGSRESRENHAFVGVGNEAQYVER